MVAGIFPSLPRYVPSFHYYYYYFCPLFIRAHVLESSAFPLLVFFLLVVDYCQLTLSCFPLQYVVDQCTPEKIPTSTRMHAVRLEPTTLPCYWRRDSLTIIPIYYVLTLHRYMGDAIDTLHSSTCLLIIKVVYDRTTTSDIRYKPQPCRCCLTLTLVKHLESVVTQRCWSPGKIRKTN